MTNSPKSEIFARLQKEISPLQGLRPKLENSALNAALGPIRYAFPAASFPLGAIHEFISTGVENAAATCGFVSGVLASIAKNNGIVIWISTARNIFPPALTSFGIAPDKIIFVELKKEKEILWAMEEALKCNGLNGVIGEINELSFTVSRRFQLAVEESQVTGFVLRRDPRRLEANACISRWQISPLPSQSIDGLPGVGFPRWKVELLKARNGKVGTWEIEWAAGQFKHIYDDVEPVWKQQKKVG